ncbi:NAD-dependent protein deacetylase [Georgenia sp. TF02-10]|uniref:NAD-dependent protein deacetylase n=1 Tax=Georgenia sp. TF02-10 TaxID=2917725 RepID=UPI001FA7DEA5|nr:NAD-dependent protein deacetylase [Georgenia sp. TF02-10]UNX55198.1 NAD-dependent protein deacetylase [Georgenia sp. TF02-10]
MTSSGPEAPAALLDRAVEVLAGRRVAVLTGAGISTDSGLPDYRGPDSPPRRPITFQQFVGDERFRRHYWARNHVGWHHMRETAPNAGHRALARLEQAGVVVGVITQNVDLLHQAAGSRRVIDLHGHYNEVVCLNCGHVEPRSVLHERLDALNPGFVDRVVADVEIAPDADAVVEETEDFRVAPCPVCGGMLKPNIVFFGENVPRPRVAAALELVDEADALLVAGSSLTVLSGLRFVRHAARTGRPIVIVNRGTTRGDDLATVKIDAGTTPVLVALADRLAPAGGDGLYRQQAGDPVADQR